MLVISGCSSTESAGAAATGVVLLDGQPQANILVNFSPVGGGSSAFGKTGADGRFEVRTAASVTGLAPGEYEVSVERVREEREPSPEELEDGYVAGDDESSEEDWEKAAGLTPIPEHYKDTETSGLKFTVSATEENDLTIELSSTATGPSSADSDDASRQGT